MTSARASRSQQLANGACRRPPCEAPVRRKCEKLAETLSADYPGSVHVGSVGLLGADDQRIWDYSRALGFAIVSKDTDFRERSFVEGFPPKVIWLDIGNAGTASITALLKRENQRVEAFQKDDETSFLILSLSPGLV